METASKIFSLVPDLKFKLDNVSQSPESMRCFGTSTFQYDDFSIETNAGDKIRAPGERFFCRQRRKESEESISNIEKSAFASTSSSIVCIGVVTPCFFASSTPARYK